MNQECASLRLCSGGRLYKKQQKDCLQSRKAGCSLQEDSVQQYAVDVAAGEVQFIVNGGTVGTYRHNVPPPLSVTGGASTTSQLMQPQPGQYPPPQRGNPGFNHVAAPQQSKPSYASVPPPGQSYPQVRATSLFCACSSLPFWFALNYWPSQLRMANEQCFVLLVAVIVLITDKTPHVTGCSVQGFRWLQ